MEIPTNTQSAWEEGLSVVESVLEPGSATERSLSGPQKEGLKKLKRLLLTGGGGRESYIPRALLKSSRVANHSGGTTTCSEQFILSAFAGYKKDDARKKFKSVIAAHTFLGRLKFSPSVSPPVDNYNHNSSSAIVAAAPGAAPYGSFLPPGFLEMDAEQQQKLCQLLSWESLRQWKFNIFRVKDVCGEECLAYVGWAILGSPYAQHAMEQHCQQPNKDMVAAPLAERPGYRFLEQYKIRERTLVAFLRAIQSRYQDVPYHNQYHAADVVQTLHTLLQMNDNVNRFVEDPLQLFAVLLAAAIHDVGHPVRTMTLDPCVWIF